MSSRGWPSWFTCESRRASTRQVPLRLRLQPTRKLSGRTLKVNGTQDSTAFSTTMKELASLEPALNVYLQFIDKDSWKCPKYGYSTWVKGPSSTKGGPYHGTGEASSGMRYPGLRLNAGTASVNYLQLKP